MTSIWPSTGQNREVALKILPESFAADPQRVQRFRQEARAVMALNHPNIVTVWRHGRLGGRLLPLNRIR